ncbi:uncharacterized protein L201_001195 [Kwoniella dendrophila CBS 6074]|uniref:RING-type domain-containing protein n=1 Tax=Kwoniella dendrophila CBS 6074 TaxID=1295534 RepID=A0AAX4JNC1_9TREE
MSFDTDTERLLAQLQLNDDDIRDILDEERDTKDDEEDNLSECVICKEDLFDILENAQTKNKGGIEGNLSLWVCELQNCGALFCIDCVTKWSNEQTATACPACTREWDMTRFNSQKDCYELMEFEWNNHKI